jgi:hypothetical protein
MEPKLVAAGIDVYKKMLAVVVVDEGNSSAGTGSAEVLERRRRTAAAVRMAGSRGVNLVVMGLQRF